MSPAIIKVLIFAALMIGAAVAGDQFGHRRGVNEQKVEDQIQFDTINAQRAAQKVTANALYRGAQAEIITLQEARANLHNQLGTEHAANQTATNNLRRELSSVRLHFAAQQGAGGYWPDGPGTTSPTPNPAGDASPAVCVVSREVDEALKAIVYDADSLRDDYTLLYNYVHRVK